MALSENKKRINISLTYDELEIIQTISKKNRHTVSNTVAILIEKYLKPEFDNFK